MGFDVTFVRLEVCSETESDIGRQMVPKNGVQTEPKECCKISYLSVQKGGQPERRRLL